MLTVTGSSYRLCDGVSRRSFLRIGALGVGAGALTLSDLFRLEEASGQTPSRHKAVINIFLGGGPPHQDMWEIKTEGPARFGGSSIRSVPACRGSRSARSSPASPG